MAGSSCCNGTGFADYAAVPCPDPACPVQAPRAGTWVRGHDHEDALQLIDELLACFVLYAHGGSDDWTAGVRLRRDRADRYVARRAALGRP